MLQVESVRAFTLFRLYAALGWLRKLPLCLRGMQYPQTIGFNFFEVLRAELSIV